MATSEEFRSGSGIRTGYIKGQTFGYRAIQYEVIDGEAIFEGDIVLGTVEEMDRLAAEIEANPEGVNNQARGVVITGEKFRWPEGIVPFTIDPALTNVTRVNNAIAHWHQNTGIRLVARTNESNFVTFRSGSGCSSSVGMKGGATIYYTCQRLQHRVNHS